ncbi:hypothetical protein BD311DRAFT_865698 [Dichomitus squalens]|uniref:Uncharacterized protein n=1 Tax=Dichomitus squalens TaxID=114155 RepID=A0A4Q9MMH2_9APHY|nr:hypothetical protein BD311DRAFT_865698 [Dichomitus squalens]
MYDVGLHIANSIDDFCFFSPQQPGVQSTIGPPSVKRGPTACSLDTEPKPFSLTPSPAHTLSSPPDCVKVTGVGDLTKVNVLQSDSGGELDPHAAGGNDDTGIPIGRLVASSVFGGVVQQIHEWTNFMDYESLCIRASHLRRVGYQGNMPGDYTDGFDSRKDDIGEPTGVSGTSTLHQGKFAASATHPAPATSQCTKVATIGSGSMSASTSTSCASASSQATDPSSPGPRPHSDALSHYSAPTAGHVSGNGAESLFGHGLDVAVVSAARRLF